MRRPLLAIALLAPLALGAQAGDPVQRALDHLAATRTADGWAAPPANVVEAIAAAGLDPKAWPPERPAFALLAPSTLSDDQDRYRADLRVAYAVAASGYHPDDVAPGFLDALKRGYRERSDPTLVNDDVWFILAMRAAGVPASDDDVRAAVLTVKAARCASGGWGHAPQAFCGADMTGMALAALASAGEPVRGDAQAIAFLRSLRDESGGYRDFPPGTPILGSTVTTQSTAWAIHGLALLGERVDADRAALAAKQRPDGGFPREWQGATSDDWATAEVIVALAARHPLPAFAPGVVRAPELHALDPATLVVDGPFTRATWTIDGAPATMPYAFPSAGSYSYQVHAEGATARWRGSGTLTVLSGRPIVDAPAEVEALRFVPVDLGVAAQDPDGAVARVRIDWGDGNVTDGPHAYARPGDVLARVRAQDDAGVWSHPRDVIVHVRNRAPILDAPARVVADRTREVALDAAARDPEGDVVSVEWTLDDAPQGSALRWRPDRLGNVTAIAIARDAYGAQTRATVVIEVVNVPPTIRAVTLPLDGRAGTQVLTADADDADGDDLEVEWRVGERVATGARVEVKLDAGRHDVVVSARDGDGGLARWRGELVVLPPDADAPPPTLREEVAPAPAADEPRALPPLAPPDLDGVPDEARAGEALEIVLPPVPDASSYRFELGDGNATEWGPGTALAHAYAQPGDHELRVHARSDDGRASVATKLIHVAAPAPPPHDEDHARSAKPVEEAAPEVTTPEAPLEASQALAPAAQQRRETPGPATLVALLAALATRRARAAR